MCDRSATLSPIRCQHIPTTPTQIYPLPNYPLPTYIYYPNPFPIRCQTYLKTRQKIIGTLRLELYWHSSGRCGKPNTPYPTQSAAHPFTQPLTHPLPIRCPVDNAKVVNYQPYPLPIRCPSISVFSMSQVISLGIFTAETQSHTEKRYLNQTKPWLVEQSEFSNNHHPFSPRLVAMLPKLEAIPNFSDDCQSEHLTHHQFCSTEFGL